MQRSVSVVDPHAQCTFQPFEVICQTQGPFWCLHGILFKFPVTIFVKGSETLYRDSENHLFQHAYSYPSNEETIERWLSGDNSALGNWADLETNVLILFPQSSKVPITENNPQSDRIKNAEMMIGGGVPPENLYNHVRFEFLRELDS